VSGLRKNLYLSPMVLLEMALVFFGFS